MAQQSTITLVDDLDGGKAAETITFGLDGAKYEIDLSKKNAAALRKALDPFLAKGRKASARVTVARKAKAAAGPSPAVVREWAAANGVAVSARGRVSGDVYSAYEAAQN